MQFVDHEPDFILNLTWHTRRKESSETVGSCVRIATITDQRTDVNEGQGVQPAWHGFSAGQVHGDHVEDEGQGDEHHAHH